MKSSGLYRLKLNLANKIDLKRSDKYLLPYQVSVSTIHEKILKIHIKAGNLKNNLKHGMINLNYLMFYFLYQIFNIIWSIL